MSFGPLDSNNNERSVILKFKAPNSVNSDAEKYLKTEALLDNPS